MALLLPAERKSAKGKLFLALTYGLLAIGGVTMVLPFMVMLASSFSSGYDYGRHAPFVKAAFSRNDRFLRSMADCFQRFPREVFPEAPAEWHSWNDVMRDAAGADRFANSILDPLTGDSAKFASARERARRFRDAAAKWDLVRTTCNYDARDVYPFLARHFPLEKINREWPVKHKSLFDVSFRAESKAPIGSASWRPPAEDPKFAAWLEFKDSYRKRMVERGDYVSRTMPFPLEAVADDLRAALAVQFLEHGWRDFLESAAANYRLVSQYLFLRGRAFANTFVLVVLSVLAALTVNPLAAYALSRFHMKSSEKVLLFMLATMAFPAAVTAIPGFLLIRDLGLLNTFAALVLPTVASGMTIFVQKGFFDALPRELYEAAAIDGAGELTVFRKITLPMTTPILAVNALNHFVAAYNSWEWAFLVCQEESHWTIAVWMYQMSQHFAGQPWCVMAGFVLVSIPTALVFLLCQKVILKGIVLPSMK